jgi:hypothetical protein
MRGLLRNGQIMVATLAASPRALARAGAAPDARAPATIATVAVIKAADCFAARQRRG